MKLPLRRADGTVGATVLGRVKARLRLCGLDPPCARRLTLGRRDAGRPANKFNALRRVEHRAVSRVGVLERGRGSFSTRCGPPGAPSLVHPTLRLEQRRELSPRAKANRPSLLGPFLLAWQSRKCSWLSVRVRCFQATRPRFISVLAFLLSLTRP